jgi:hypothetical protein
MKRTLVCIHVLPHELLMFERWMNDFRRSLPFLTPSDHLNLRPSLNLNPRLTDWSTSPLPQEYFVAKFLGAIHGIQALHEIRSDDSLAGTSQQKRECIALDYDQFIFADPDIAFPPYLIKGELDVASKLSGRYMIFPPVVRLWEPAWDHVVHPDFLSKPLGYYLTHSPDETRRQSPKEISAVPLGSPKFGTGWMNMYSKDLMMFIGIPASLGGYGAEDNFIGISSEVACQNGFPVSAYLLRNVYISEDYVSRDTTLPETLNFKDTREKQRLEAENHVAHELSAFAKRAMGKNISFTFGE